MDLAILLEHCKRGDQLAWEALVRQYQGRVYAIAYHYVGNAEDARDLAQEIFVRLYGTVKTIDHERFVPWLIRISRNASIDFLRRRKVRPQSGETDISEMTDLANEDANPEELCEAGLRRSVLYRALRRLTGLNREVIILKEIHELPIEEIASLLGVPVGTVKSRSNRARLELARKIVELGGLPNGE